MAVQRLLIQELIPLISHHSLELLLELHGCTFNTPVKSSDKLAAKGRGAGMWMKIVVSLLGCISHCR
jgi:hypothetical protein